MEGFQEDLQVASDIREDSSSTEDDQWGRSDEEEEQNATAQNATAAAEQDDEPEVGAFDDLTEGDVPQNLAQKDRYSGHLHATSIRVDPPLLDEGKK